MSDDQVRANLQGMDDLDFDGWNNADWNGVSRTTTPTTCSSTGRVRTPPTVSRRTSMR